MVSILPFEAIPKNEKPLADPLVGAFIWECPHLEDLTLYS
jgi:hypothetical protein